MKTTIVLIAMHTALFAQSYTISTIAGGGAPPTSVPATSVRVPISVGLARSNAGEIYFTSGNAVMKVDAKGVLTRFAGTGQYGISKDGGPALSAPLAWPAGLAVDNFGNLFIVENAAHRVRKVTADGTISTVAGTGVAGNSGDGGPSVNAQFNWPTAVTVDASNNLYVADTSNGQVRKVSPDGIISTVASNLQDAQAVAIDASGSLFIAEHYLIQLDSCGDDQDVGRIIKVTGGVVQKVFDGPDLALPRSIALDAAGSVYVSDAGLWRISRISSGVISTVVGGPDGKQLIGPTALAVDGSGVFYVSDPGHSRIAKISPQGELTNVVGDGFPGNYWSDGGKATDSALSSPFGVAVDSSGNLYIADFGNNRVRKVSADGSITTIAGNGSPGFAGDGGPATAAQLKTPAGVAVDASGNVYIADSGNNRIRKVSKNGVITTVAGRGDINPPLGDGGSATSAALAGPLAVAVDASGNLYIADTNFLSIRKVSTAGIITTLAGSNYYAPSPINIGFPTGLALDTNGDVFITGFAGLTEVLANGAFSTVVGNQFGHASGDGGPASKAALTSPISVALDGTGNVYISGGPLSGYAPFGAGYVRKITTDGIINTIAGNGVAGYSGDSGPATSASFSPAAAGIAVDAAGTVYIADVFNNVVRALRPASNK
jgi:sugar lactone lactonase YvrE